MAVRVRQLGDARGDLVSLLALPLGATKAEKVVADMEATVSAAASRAASDAATKVVVRGLIAGAITTSLLLAFAWRKFRS